MKKIFLVQVVIIYTVCASNYASTLMAASRSSEPIAKSSVKSGEPGVKSINKEISGDEKSSISVHANNSHGAPTVENPTISRSNETPVSVTTISTKNNDQGINLENVNQNENVDTNASTSHGANLQEKLLISEPVSLIDETVQSVDSREGKMLFDDTDIDTVEVVNDQKVENNNDVSQVQTQFVSKATMSIVDQIQTPDKITVDAMNKFLPEGEKMVVMGRRADGSNYMITAKTKAKIAIKDAKIDTMNVLEFDMQGQPVRDLNGQIKTTSLPMSEYQSQLSAPRENLLKQAQQDLANFEQPDNLQQKTAEYQKQEAAYNEAKATRDNLEKKLQTDPSTQVAYDASEKDYQAAQQAFSMEDPQVTLNKLQEKVNQYSDKQTRVAMAEKKLQDAKQSSIDIAQKITNLEAALKNESNAAKRIQISSELQAAKNTEYFADQNIKNAINKLQYTKNSTYSTDTADFQAVFDDVTAQFVNDPAVMESLRNNKDYQDYREQVTKEIYKPTMIKSTMNGIKNLATAMSDVGLGKIDWGLDKVFRPLTSVDLGKPFRTMATDAKYAYLGKPSRYQS